MRIAELFQSIQGEGRFAETPSVFVRTTGCNLRCWFCDTPYTSWEPEGEHLPWTRVLEQILEFDCRHVVVTGGEPLLQPDVVPLTHALSQAGRFVTIETAATVYRPVKADLMSISPKLANSTPTAENTTGGQRWKQRHEQTRDNPETMRRFIDEYAYQIKFVVDRPDDLIEIDGYVSRRPKLSAENIFLMPQAISVRELTEKTGWLTRAAEQRGWNVSPRLHIERYGNVRGK